MSGNELQFTSTSLFHVIKLNFPSGLQLQVDFEGSLQLEKLCPQFVQISTQFRNF